MKWSNKGAAPCYGGGYACITLKDENGGMTGVFVAPSFNVRSLEVRPKESPPVREVTHEFAFPQNMPKGTFDVFISVGTVDGTPRIALPLEGHDGHRRYKVSSITVE